LSAATVKLGSLREIEGDSITIETDELFVKTTGRTIGEAPTVAVGENVNETALKAMLAGGIAKDGEELSGDQNINVPYTLSL
jgi:hypothetical protein